MTNLSDLGEFGLIDRLARIIGPPNREDLIVGIGDDAAVWRTGDRFVLATTDTMVEGVHFERALSPWADVGWKALAVNVSDIAAMGGEPTFALITLALPDNVPPDDVEMIYAGLSDCARNYGVTIAGGDVVRAPQVSVTVALLGEAHERGGAPLILRRDAARPGDLIATTGRLGDSAAGLIRLREGVHRDDPLVRKHLRPRPPLSGGRFAASTGITCGIDISDGLLQDVGHVCEASGVGAIIRAKNVPMSREMFGAFPNDALRLACTVGEDYELCLVGDRDLLDALSPELVEPLRIIGEIVADSEHRVRLLDAAGNEITFDRPGWDAFK